MTLPTPACRTCRSLADSRVSSTRKKFGPGGGTGVTRDLERQGVTGNAGDEQSPVPARTKPMSFRPPAHHAVVVEGAISNSLPSSPVVESWKRSPICDAIEGRHHARARAFYQREPGLRLFDLRADDLHLRELVGPRPHALAQAATRSAFQRSRSLEILVLEQAYALPLRTMSPARTKLAASSSGRARCRSLIRPMMVLARTCSWFTSISGNQVPRASRRISTPVARPEKRSSVRDLRQSGEVPRSPDACVR